MIGRPLLAAACAFFAAMPAVAQHHPGSPLNPESYDHWVELGHLKGDSESTAGTMYVDIEKGAPSWYDRNHLAVNTWIIFDRPSPTAKGPATEVHISQLVDCGTRTIDADPDLYFYDADGNLVMAITSPMGRIATMKEFHSGTAGEYVLKAVCS